MLFTWCLHYLWVFLCIYDQAYGVHILKLMLVLWYLNVTEKGVPQFWLTAMKTNEILGMQVGQKFVLW